MYQIIFTIDEIVLDNTATSAFMGLGCEWIRHVQGMRLINGRVPYLAYAPALEVINKVKGYLMKIDHPVIIGIWDESGVAIEYDFDAYHDALDDIVETDMEGNVLSSRRPTIEEAHSTQVCSFAGWATREI